VGSARVEFQHAPVFMGPQNALEGTHHAGVGRSRARGAAPARARGDDRPAPLLGPEPERAASIKLIGNLFLMFMTAARPRC